MSVTTILGIDMGGFGRVTVLMTNAIPTGDRSCGDCGTVVTASLCEGYHATSRLVHTLLRRSALPEGRDGHAGSA